MQRIQIHPLLWEILTSTLSCISIIHTPSVCAFFQRVHLLGSWEAWAPTTSSKWLTSKKSISWSRMSNQIVVSPFPIPFDFCKLQGQPQDGKNHVCFTISRSELWRRGAIYFTYSYLILQCLVLLCSGTSLRCLLRDVWLWQCYMWDLFYIADISTLNMSHICI